MAVRLSALRAGHSLPPGRLMVLTSVKRLSRLQGHSTAGRIRPIEKFNDFIGNGTRDFPACSWTASSFSSFLRASPDSSPPSWELSASPAIHPQPEPLTNINYFFARAEDLTAEPSSAWRDFSRSSVGGSMVTSRPVPVVPNGSWKYSETSAIAPLTAVRYSYSHVIPRVALRIVGRLDTVGGHFVSQWHTLRHTASVQRRRRHGSSKPAFQNQYP
jgi:hypothetical protein